MEVNRSGYYRYLKSINKLAVDKDLIVITEVKALHKLSRGSYGSRQMSENLKARGYQVGRYKARKLMQKARVICKQRRKYKITTQSKHQLNVAENLLNREFKVAKPNCFWVADITYLNTLEGWLYIAVVLDLFSRRVVGWAMAEHMREELIEEALKMALGRRNPEAGLMHHSDRGVQYASADYQAALKKAGIIVSMSRKGNCWDNSVMERFFGSLKSERTDNVKYFTRAQAKSDVIDYIEMFYNSRRLHSTLGYVSPIEFENNYFKFRVAA
jgi:putative transposase